MKHTILFLLVTICLANTNAQNNADWRLPSKDFRVWIELKKDMGLYEGYLHGLTNDQLAYKQERHLSAPDNVFFYYEIDKITFQRKGKVGRGALWGAVIGAGVGALLGTSSNNSNSDSYLQFDDSLAALSGGIVGGLVGASAGVIIGSKKSKARINGEKEAFWRFGRRVLQ